MSLNFKVLPSVLILLISVSVKAGDHAPGRVQRSTTVVEPVKAITRATDIVTFNAISDGKKVYVNWVSGNEKNYDYYTIEKARDGIHFETTAMVKGSGNTASVVDYIDIDYSPYAGISYYRLKQTDYAGEVTYSDVVSVNYQFSKDGTIISCSDFDPIDLKEIGTKEILVVVRDDKGVEYVSKVTLNTSNGSVYATDLKNRLSKGTYRVIASSYNRLFSQSLIVN